MVTILAWNIIRLNLIIKKRNKDWVEAPPQTHILCVCHTNNMIRMEKVHSQTLIEMMQLNNGRINKDTFTELNGTPAFVHFRNTKKNKNGDLLSLCWLEKLFLILKKWNYSWTLKVQVSCAVWGQRSNNSKRFITSKPEN